MKYDTQYLDKYLDGELSESEVQTFEAEMKADEDFAYEVKLHQTARETTEYASFMDKIKKVRAESGASALEVISTDEQQEGNESVAETTTNVNKKTKSFATIRRLRRALVAAASVALLIVGIPLISGDLADKHYQPYVLNTTNRSMENQELIQAEKAYNARDYETALRTFEKYPDEVRDDVRIQLAKGNTAYKLGKWDIAEATFQQIASENSVYQSTGNWYLALTFLKQKRPEKAKAALRQIETGDDEYDKAQKLLRRLE